mgnify:CR=1 FL=1
MSDTTVTEATPDEVTQIETGLEGAGDGINGTWQVVTDGVGLIMSSSIPYDTTETDDEWLRKYWLSSEMVSISCEKDARRCEL